MKIECTICSGIKKGIVRYITDIKKIFTKDFITENYYKHLCLSVILAYPCIWYLFESHGLKNTGTFFQLFIGGFGAYWANWIREWFYGKFYGAPWDDTDINMGSYGGILATILLLIINKIY